LNRLFNPSLGGICVLSTDDSQDEEEEEEEDEEARWTWLEAEEAATKKEARARTKALPACTNGDEDGKDYSLEGDTSSSDASNTTSSSEQVMSRKCLRANDEAGPSKKK
jgi:hypothetical protein